MSARPRPSTTSSYMSARSSGELQVPLSASQAVASDGNDFTDVAWACPCSNGRGDDYIRCVSVILDDAARGFETATPLSSFGFEFRVKGGSMASSKDHVHPDWREHGAKGVPGNALDSNTAQTPDMSRLAA